MGSLASGRSDAPAALSFGSEDASAWLGPGWYGVDTRLGLPMQRAYRNAALMMTIPEDARALEIALGLPEQCEFECPVAVRVLLEGTEVAVLSLSEGDVRTHSVEIPSSMRGGTVRLSFRAKRAQARKLSSRLRQCRTLGFVLESASAVRDPH
jgi:hypothetical protein